MIVDNKQTGSRIGNGNIRVQIVLQLAADCKDWRDESPVTLLRNDGQEVQITGIAT